MKVWKMLLDKVAQKSNRMIAFSGVILLISLILVYVLPHNRIFILIACLSCGVMNLLQGLKYFNDPKKKNKNGWGIILLGIMVVLAGVFIVRR